MRFLGTTAAVMLALVAGGGVLSAQEGERRFALVVGSDAGASGDGPELRYAEDDAEEVAGVLTELGGFAAGDVEQRLGAGPDAVGEAFARVRAAMSGVTGDDERTLFLFYYSGHAGLDGLHMGKGVLPYADLQAEVDAVVADVKVVVLDMCHAQAMTYLKGGRRVSPFDVVTEAAGTAYLFSAGANQVAQELRDYGHSVFTHWLLSGLRGAADESGDGWVTLPELWDYAWAGTIRTSATTGIRQEPALMVQMTGVDKVWLANLNGVASSEGYLEFGAYGDFVVYRSSGETVCEAYVKVPGQRVALAEGDYFIRRKGGGELREAAVTVRGGQAVALDEGDFEEVAFPQLADEARRGSNWFRSGPEAIVQVRSTVLEDLGMRLSGGVAWPMVMGHVFVTPRLSLGGLSHSTPTTSIALYEVQPDLAVGFGLDLGPVVVVPRVSAGALFLHEEMSDYGSDISDSRTSTGATAGAGASFMLTPFSGAFYVEAVAEGTWYLLRQDDGGWGVTPALLVTIGLGVME